ncbi:hypothetical protein B9Z55_018330 [Caenorhabditis nigoni]|uniref:Uncharacterized protein n=1 Tax=Caenorhabditis nigoni TaxID=1611254 RepID=A0A2G5TDE7_9PELO|nr:hypothetical protein B9Z55_018330 [Caenorhabditis nigoni]
MDFLPKPADEDEKFQIDKIIRSFTAKMKPDELNTKCSDSLYLIHANVRGCCELMEELSICQPGIRSKVHWKKHIRIFQYGNQRFALSSKSFDI